MNVSRFIPKVLLLAVLTLSTTALAQDVSWRDLPLTDARTGETFTLADLGDTVLVEPMATWCANCRHQLGNIRDAKTQLGNETQVTFVALSVETTLGADALARYAEEQGFDFTFAVMTPEMLRALAAEFGQAIASPPSTPHFVIYPDGTTTDLFTGFQEPAELLALVAP